MKTNLKLLRKQRDLWMLSTLEYLKNISVALDISTRQEGWLYQIIVRYNGHEMVLKPEANAVIDGKPMSYGCGDPRCGLDYFAIVTETPQLRYS